MEPFDLNAIEVNVEMDQNDSPEHIVWNDGRVFNIVSCGAVYHPTQKPVELGRYLIRTYTNPGDIVLDNACGSGSFCVAAVLEGRSFIGIEKNEDVALFKKRPVDYIDICNQRIKEAKRTFEAKQQAIS